MITGLFVTVDRKFDFEIPFFDSEVGRDILVADAWGWELRCIPIRPEPPSIVYEGTPPRSSPLR